MVKIICLITAYTLVSAILCFAEDSADVVSVALRDTTELSRKVVDLGTHKITYIRVTPPRIPQSPAAPIPAPAPLSPEQVARYERRAVKVHATLSVTGIVYVGTPGVPTVTELSWSDEAGRRFRCWSNADFRLLTQLNDIETETHVFMWFPFISEIPLSEVPPADRPAGLSLFTAADTAPEYFFEGTDADMAAAASTLAGLDYLHALYEINRAQLAQDYARRVAEAKEQAEALAKNPPKPADSVIHFWKNPASPGR